MKKKPAKVDSKEPKKISTVTPANRRETGVKKLLNGGVDPSVGKQTQYKPGQSGNPNGRGPDYVGEAYLELLPELFPGDTEGRNYAQMIALAQFKQAIIGNTQAAKEIADRTQGKAPQNLIIHDSDSTDDPIERIQRILARGRERLAKQGIAPGGTSQNC